MEGKYTGMCDLGVSGGRILRELPADRLEISGEKRANYACWCGWAICGLLQVQGWTRSQADPVYGWTVRIRIKVYRSSFVDFNS